uniref:protein-L-isoaspartate(D-aspartate) O-methyltransferase n=2 Tax=Chrysotila carterae TaxID=13221 RepID=A0A7S4B5V0_CHRCT|mmetsp:Transcript_38447/g.80761  ORF Transcript_38447/g.80761 Transcript_38447/m.80761 type:complete len:234 (+) Transcript_38447:321-1022(+)
MHAAYRCSAASNAALVLKMWTAGLIADPRIRTVLERQDRGNYCKDLSTCYNDSPQQIGWGITISAPHMHAQALEQLKDHLRPGCKALDVGSGSGYLTVAMAQMVGDAGQAIGIDHVPELVEWSRENVRRDGKEEMLASGQLQLFTADGFGGAPHAAPFDCIHVGAAPLEVPPALKQQLKPGGVLLLPVGPAHDQAFVRITRSSDGNDFSEERLFGVRYVPLTSLEAQLGRRAN